MTEQNLPSLLPHFNETASRTITNIGPDFFLMVCVTPPTVNIPNSISTLGLPVGRQLSVLLPCRLQILMT